MKGYAEQNLKKSFFRFLRRSSIFILAGVIFFGIGFWLGQVYRLQYRAIELYGFLNTQGSIESRSSR